jgi:hypothetical protein
MYGISASLNIGSGTAYNSGPSVVVTVPDSSVLHPGNVICFYPSSLTGAGQIYYRVVTQVVNHTTVYVDRAISLPSGYSLKWAYAAYFPLTAITGAGGMNDIKYSNANKTIFYSQPGLPTCNAMPTDISDNPVQTITARFLYFGNAIQLGDFKLNLDSMSDGLQYDRNAYLFMSDIPDRGIFVYLESFDFSCRVEMVSGTPTGSAEVSLKLYERQLEPF